MCERLGLSVERETQDRYFLVLAPADEAERKARLGPQEVPFPQMGILTNSKFPQIR